MARTKSKDLTEAELRLMQVIWKMGPATVSEVAERLSKHDLAYNTVLTTMRILEDKGYLRHTKPEAGRAFGLSPCGWEAGSEPECRQAPAIAILRRLV